MPHGNSSRRLLACSHGFRLLKKGFTDGKFIIAAIATGLLLLFFERSNMATTNIVGQSADVRSVRPDR
jgi:hypothetical protein